MKTTFEQHTPGLALPFVRPETIQAYTQGSELDRIRLRGDGTRLIMLHNFELNPMMREIIGQSDIREENVNAAVETSVVMYGMLHKEGALNAEVYREQRRAEARSFDISKIGDNSTQEPPSPLFSIKLQLAQWARRKRDSSYYHDFNYDALPTVSSVAADGPLANRVMSTHNNGLYVAIQGGELTGFEHDMSMEVGDVALALYSLLHQAAADNKSYRGGYKTL